MRRENEVFPFEGCGWRSWAKPLREGWIRSGNGSSTRDLCLLCARCLERNSHCWDTILLPYKGDEPGEDGRSSDCAHPSYEDDEYRCFVPTCRARLIAER